MRLLHVIDTGGAGGAEQMFARLAAGLSRRGWPAVALVGRAGWLSERLAADGIRAHCFEQRPGGYAQLRRLLDLGRETRPTAVICHLFGASLYGSLAARLLRVPSIGVLHGQTDVAPNERLLTVKRALLNACCDRVVFVSEALRDALQPRLSLPSARIEVIENGVDVQALAAAPPSTLRDELDVPADAFLVGALGNVRPAKDYDVLIDAASRVSGADGSVWFVVAGDDRGALADRLKQRVRDAGLAARFRFLGLRNDVANVLGGLDLFVLSSRSEGFSLACVEAMALSRPIVATRSGGPEQILEGGRHGALVPPGDPEALASAILELRNDPVKRAELGASGRRRAEASYDLARMIDRYAALVRLLAGSPARTTASSRS